VTVLLVLVVCAASMGASRNGRRERNNRSPSESRCQEPWSASL